MGGVAHTIPFFIRNEADLALADICLKSLADSSQDSDVVVYNQGKLSNEELNKYFKNYALRFHIIGEGKNIGIAQGRMACFEYIWNYLTDIKYISEIHVDMFFPQGWVEALVNFLEKNSVEPLICPGILTSRGELHPEDKETKIISEIPFGNSAKMHSLLKGLTTDKLIEGFVHPVMHRSEVLKKVGGYDTRFIRGQQGYEDDSLLLGYRYYIGLKNNWVPQCYVGVRVYHATLTQRITLTNIQQEFDKNLQGLFYQYGIKGLMELTNIYKDNQHFNKIVDHLLKQINH
ncbi:MAG: glycosyltransferase [Bacillota bacterium]